MVGKIVIFNGMPAYIPPGDVYGFDRVEQEFRMSDWVDKLIDFGGYYLAEEFDPERGEYVYIIHTDNDGAYMWLLVISD